MASIKERNGKFSVIYMYTDSSGVRKQKWETYATKAEARRRKKEIEFRTQTAGLIIPKCTTLDDLLKEYVALYGRQTWAMSTYDRNLALIRNYIHPMIGSTKLTSINTHFLDVFYQRLEETPAVMNPAYGRSADKTVSINTIRDINKILRSSLNQAVKWELMERNPAMYATIPKYKQKERSNWTTDILAQALAACDDEYLKLSLNLGFSCSLRIGELLGLTWDCVDISEESIQNGTAHIYINKELQRVSKAALQELKGKDILLIFPEKSSLNRTVRVLKTPKTESSVRKVFLPVTVAKQLIQWRAQQNEMKNILGGEYQDYNLVMANTYGLPLSENQIRTALNRLIRDNNLPDVVFHSIRHTSITCKLEVTNGDIKAVQGDSGHAQAAMITDIYAHIRDKNRNKIAELLEDIFYSEQNSEHGSPSTSNVGALLDNIDPERLNELLQAPGILDFLTKKSE